MSVTLFGLLWLYGAAMVLFARKIDAVLVFTLFSMVFQCNNVVYFGDQGVGPQILASMLFIVKSMFYASANSRMRIDSRYVCALALLVIVLISSALNNVLSSVAINIAQLAVYIICFIRFFSISHLITRTKVIDYFVRLVMFVATVGIIQYFMALGFLPRFEIVRELIYNDPDPNIYFNTSAGIRLYATFMEPSYCAPFLVGAFYFILISRKEKTKFDHVLLIILLIEIILTQSTTGYISFILLALMHILVFKDKNAAKYLVPEMVILLFALIASPDLLNTVIFSKTESGSSITRDIWNAQAIEMFEEHPLFGIGYKQVRASGIGYSLLGEIGIFGLVAYLGFIIVCLVNRLREDGSRTRCVRSLIIAVVFCQLIAIPDLDFCVLWVCLYMYAAVCCCSRNDEDLLALNHEWSHSNKESDASGLVLSRS